MLKSYKYRIYPTNNQKEMMSNIFGQVRFVYLGVSNMLKNNNLSRAISDMGWNEFKSMLEYKCDWYGKNLSIIGRFDPSSKTCSSCGTINKELALNNREWVCSICGKKHDRDINAAINIRNFGLRNQPSVTQSEWLHCACGVEVVV